MKADAISVLHIQKVAGIAGSENHLLTLLPRLREYGYQPTMLVLADRNDRPSPFVESMRTAGISTDVMMMLGDVDPLLVLRLARLMKRRGYPIVHTHLFHADIYGTLGGRLAGIRNIVSTKHGFNPWRYKRGYALLDRTAGYFQQRVITISGALGRWLVRVERLPTEKIRVVHYAIDANQFCDGISSSHDRLANIATPIVGTVSRLIHQKGVHILIQAFADCLRRHGDCSLIIVGDGPVRSKLERQASNLDISGRVHFLGYVAHPELSSVIREFDVFALPTFGEGFGLVLLEAMCCGKPIVASEVMSIPEIVLDGKTGILVPPNDMSSLSDALLKLIQDERLGQQFGTAGRERVEQKFTVERMVQGTIEVYEDMLRYADPLAPP
jgi:glycosyltransferase involved in cell wall biosynthesis